MKNAIRKLLSYMLVFSIITSTSITASASEVPNRNYSSYIYLNTKDNVTETLPEGLYKVLEDSFQLPKSHSLRSAGLAWGPVKVGNLEFKITNPHMGYVSGLGYVNHVNFHITKTSNKRDVANYHIVKYTSGGRDCLYVYESVTRKVVINNCYGNWRTAVGDIIAAAQDVVKASLSEADWVATLAIWGVILIVIIDVVAPLDPIPILPLSPPDLVEY